MNGEQAPQAAAADEPATQAVPRWQRRAITALAAAAAGVSWGALDRLAPFRFGLLSVAWYAAPAAVAVTAVRRTRTIPAARDRRRTLGQALAIMAGLLVLAVPFGHLQRAVAPTAWMAESGIPSRAYLQVITIPGMWQEPYAREGDQVTAYFDTPIGPLDFWGTIEAVRGPARTRAPPCTTRPATGSPRTPPGAPRPGPACECSRPALAHRSASPGWPTGLRLPSPATPGT